MYLVGHVGRLVVRSKGWLRIGAATDADVAESDVAESDVAESDVAVAGEVGLDLRGNSTVVRKDRTATLFAHDLGEKGRWNPFWRQSNRWNGDRYVGDRPQKLTMSRVAQAQERPA